MAGPEREGLEEVLEYLARLDDALEEDLRPGERKLVRKDVRRLVEDLAFRFTFLDGRLAPVDVDYARALEALKPPAHAAESFRARRPAYRRRARAGALRRGAFLVLLAGAAWLLLSLSATETSVFLGEYAFASPDPVTRTDVREIEVPEGLLRVYLVAEPLVRNDGRVTVSVYDPERELLWTRTYVRGTRAYDDANLPAVAGTWHLVVDYHDALANVRVRLTGVQPV